MFLNPKQRIFPVFRQEKNCRIRTENSAFFFSYIPNTLRLYITDHHPEVISFDAYMYDNVNNQLTGQFGTMYNGRTAYLAVSFEKSDNALFDAYGLDCIELNSLSSGYKIIGSTIVSVGQAIFDFELKSNTLFSMFIL